jgi:hypothetical protein
MGAALDQYARDLHHEVLLRTGDDTNIRLREEAFTEITLELLDEHNEVDVADLASYEAKGTARAPSIKISAWSLSGDGATLDLFISLYYGSASIQEVGKPDVRRNFELLTAFLKRSLDGLYTKLEESSDAFEAAQRIYNARESLTTVRLFFLTDGVVRSLQVEPVHLPGLEVKHVVWDLEKLSRLRPGDRQVIELDFVKDYEGAIPCIQMADATGEYRTFLAFMPGRLLARIYGEHGQRLLERNVRAFLQAKGKINRGLQMTVRDEPHRFLAYNNGLCCTAAEVDVDVSADGHARLRSVKDFQIVNGGQTTASIYHAVKKEKLDISQVVIQLKLTVLKNPDAVAEIVPLISRFANSQNKVNTADFSANGRFHHAIEQLSRAVWAPAATGVDRQTHWYYERARGSYADDRGRQGSPAQQREWESQNPAHQKFTKTDLAKFEQAWLGLPQVVCLGAEKSFLRFAERMDDDGEPVGVDTTYFKRLVAKGILLRTTEKIFSALGLPQYRAQSVAYAVAWLADRSGRRINLDRIWETQRLSPALCDALKVACAEAHRHITSQVGNPGEASKKDWCWNDFRKQDFALGDAWLSELAAVPFVAPHSDEEALSLQWESVRHRFAEDSRHVAELEAITGRSWVSARRSDPISKYASCTWDELREMRGLGMKKLRELIHLAMAASAS